MRPQTFDDFVGQELVARQIKLALTSAIQRKDVIDHVLLGGPPGLGKTTIARIIANTLGTKCVEIIANVIRTPADVTASLVHLRRGDVLFIDEIHALPKDVQEYLYPAMEDYAISMIGNVSRREAITIKLNKFVLVGATTTEGVLNGPILERFGIVCRLKPYSEDDIKEIIRRHIVKEGVKITDNALSIIANRSRATPRIALRHFRRIRDSATIHGNVNTFTEDVVMHAYSVLGIGKFGLTEQDLLILRILAKSDYIMGVAALASGANTTVATIETVIEPHLMRIGAVERTPRGRKITAFGRTLI